MQGSRADRMLLVALSAMMLFVELALIRWTGSNVVYLSYFSNFVLLGSFLGIGIGFLRAGHSQPLFPFAPFALAGLVAFVTLFPVEIDRSGDQLIYFGEFEPTGLPAWITLPVVFVIVAFVLATIADGVARVFARFAPLTAYRLDVTGSLIGIAAFSMLSFFQLAPLAWGLVVAVVMGLCLLVWDVPATLRGGGLIALVGIAGILGAESAAPGTVWSPYYKIEVTDRSRDSTFVAQIDVNGIPHQSVSSVEARREVEPIYFLPYERATSTPEDVLIVGAGNGTDTAIALAEGAERVDAVEIDPGIAELGRLLNPERPFDDPRVELHIDDGRAFLERTSRTYDMIVFALPDSLTLVSGQSSLRLESFLFTREALAEARAHLKPGGVFTMYNFYREDWLIDRLAGTLQSIYGSPPCVERVGDFGGLAVLMAASDDSALECRDRWTPASAAPAPVTDDYPFLYLRDRSLPSIYTSALALILLVSFLGVRAAAGPFRRMLPYLDLFLMGAAFLLLETKSVVQFALLFGTTWFVNALVFAGILLAVLAAIEIARHWRPRRPELIYAALLVSLVIAFVIPESALLDLAVPLRFVAAVTLAFTPVLLANLVFAERFRDSGDSTTAFGANLLGAMVGGVLEYSALLTNYSTLLILAALLYAGAFLAGRRHLRGAT